MEKYCFMFLKILYPASLHLVSSCFRYITVVSTFVAKLINETWLLKESLSANSGLLRILILAKTYFIGTIEFNALQNPLFVMLSFQLFLLFFPRKIH